MSTSPFYHQQPFCQLATGCQVLEVDPPADLAPYVAQLSFVNIRAPYVRQLVPDACFGIFLGVNERTGEVRSMIRPPSLKWGHWPLQSGWKYVEARLRWGAGMRFLQCSPEDLGPFSRRPEDVLGKRWRNVRERAAEARNSRERMIVLVGALRGLVENSAPLRPEIQMTTDLMEAPNPWLRVDDLAHAACLSSSQLRRLYAKELGASPKELLRLSRLWWSMKMSLDHPETSWGVIAAECGFSDQAHLVDEYRHFTGSPPRLWQANLYGVQSSLSTAV